MSNYSHEPKLLMMMTMLMEVIKYGGGCYGADCGGSEVDGDVDDDDDVYDCEDGEDDDDDVVLFCFGPDDDDDNNGDEIHDDGSFHPRTCGPNSQSQRAPSQD